jgi:HPt (histidine-containing phosphotransfer) domain-containing protein
MGVVMSDNIVSLADLIEQRLRKQQELDYYKETLKNLQTKIFELDKEVDITTLIIDMIEGERVLTLDEKRGNILLLNDKKDKK